MKPGPGPIKSSTGPSRRSLGLGPVKFGPVINPAGPGRSRRPLVESAGSVGVVPSRRKVKKKRKVGYTYDMLKMLVKL
ncbi:unnamed protein product [Didymodactylos carnosus]|uniref:Uncharacterized protein n=1 Tax=Didymodactylos carnosus TaxID=1234261 RepID=A0A816D0I5_9BILA|nr:unnamed protein product [Didymodactylos carnosus]CAF1630910.1 unnamed protein product [Didymodactylos carnosus]CAF4358864.1 unnamed protein product [Didymodactylos carnosus]CAF4529914.1 unnamed protein product [Didymodactylos carnosus]